MFLVFLTSVLLGGGLFLLWFSRGCECGYGDCRHDVAKFFGVAILIVATVAFFATFVSMYSEQKDNFATVRKLQEEVKLLEAKRDNLSMVVRLELSKYPEYEKAMVGGINPQIFLNFPNLKSNETMVETLKQLLVLENDVYGTRQKLLGVQERIFAREISPWAVYVTPYEDFFGEKNPVAALPAR